MTSLSQSQPQPEVEFDAADPVIRSLATVLPTTWLRGDLDPSADVLQNMAANFEASEDHQTGVDPGLMNRAAQRFARFAPWFAETFPETAAAEGIIESALVPADAAQADLNERLGADLPGRLWLKRDDALPISGSIKARGGFHEVLEYAEVVAAELELNPNEVATYSSGEFRAHAATHRIVVGSTGNLGLSIGILSAALGFAASVHMSADAREWKKELLRSHGVEVIEHAGDFVAAVSAGRASTEGAPRTHFVDDEDSRSLFAGYSVAALRLKEQLDAAQVAVDVDHPLFVYLPCGIGGGPGGVTYGLKRVFGDAVHAIFVEPSQAPAMFLGVRTGLHSAISVQDIGLSGATAADGLAVARPSRFIGPVISPLISGFATVTDEVIKAGVAVLHQTEGLDVEPSATAGLTIPWRMMDHLGEGQGDGSGGDGWDNATHLVWLTGGAMVPAADHEHYLAEGLDLLPRLSS
ncbi:MAG: D-serine ammonia-lyase [Brevibacterium aurantiacum]|uniref:Probable D-serine dehydratase n=1 Tax=Brevibacterium aurantiacum TaxID=273384 RepID=A0A1D7W8Y5_BREAU|nr:D-serine ammonia-lyase [Brevibacterium aurantiacum]AOP55470.1 D-serine dehydratase [Brevibacterium aurantiacum]AZL10964.1 D-serine ammonia-lyase [Brevibacterium aurantiacum]PCC56074.1 D-serine ammonia-lyase [Brevibacterium aurantiacum]RCS93942.1 D-serine ammonia-lyase [Brevibacterium aurantiacum]RCS99766.1 D-serine ammonia-lyase [Brevibacterium aurantiacum]